MTQQSTYPSPQLPPTARHLSPKDKDVLMGYLALCQAWAIEVLARGDLRYVRALQAEMVELETRYPWVKEH